MRFTIFGLLLIDRALSFSLKPSHSHARRSEATRLFSTTEGLLKTVTKEGSGAAVKLGDIATVKYSCYLPDDDTIIPFAKSSRQKVAVGDGSMVDGWDKALRSMKVGERSIVRVTDPNLGYGSTGIPPIVPPNAVLEFDIEVLDSQPATLNIDFDSLAMADTTPRTASEIQAAFEARQAAKPNVPQKEGLEGFLEKAKNFYFFGLFEGETGERPPWFLQPSITFPLAFTIVGLAFYISYAGGAITERGAETKDELDEIILSLGLPPSGAMAVAVTAFLASNAIDLGF